MGRSRCMVLFFRIKETLNCSNYPTKLSKRDYCKNYKPKLYIFLISTCCLVSILSYLSIEIAPEDLRCIHKCGISWHYRSSAALWLIAFLNFQPKYNWLTRINCILVTCSDEIQRGNHHREAGSFACKDLIVWQIIETLYFSAMVHRNNDRQ